MIEVARHLLSYVGAAVLAAAGAAERLRRWVGVED